MLVERKVLEDYLYKELSLISSNTRKKKKIYKELEFEYNMPVAISSDIMSLRKELDCYNEFELFLILSKLDKKKVSEFYTEKEIKRYNDEKYQVEKVEFPIKFKVVQVTDDQWIGGTSFKFLMELRNSGLINYNENTQRTLTRKIKNGIEKFVISLNLVAVKAIREAIISGRYIPDTVTLNMQEDDDELDYIYNSKTCELIVRSASALDIIDGYHRYIAFGQIYDLDNENDYPIEIRITNFSEAKANQFIYQQDQKTKMKKSDSNSFNQFNAGNQVVERLNQDAQFNLCGQIKKAGGYIDYGVFAATVNGLFFNNKEATKKQIIEKSKIIKNGINAYTEEYNEFIDRKWTIREIVIILYGVLNEYSSKDIYSNIHVLDSVDILKIIRDGKLNGKVKKILEEV